MLNKLGSLIENLAEPSLLPDGEDYNRMSQHCATYFKWIQIYPPLVSITLKFELTVVLKGILFCLLIIYLPFLNMF